MPDIAIHVEHLVKTYPIGRSRRRQDSLMGLIGDVLRAPLTAFRRSETAQIVSALNDVSFEVGHGEVVGLIGRNGSGKSTLLKILSRITEPTSGQARIRGRVACLLEVGTGFDRELTGRENIFLSGAVLGMSRVEITRRFDEIVEFSGVERFIDTPVKHYSSGMYLRLGFAVMAHLESEILFVDEVLAVGDAVFQKKCLNKMEAVGRQGRTVLFVSHSMPAITSLCSRAILLGDGRILQDGPTADVIHAYLAAGTAEASSKAWPDERTAPGNHIARLIGVRVVSASGETCGSFDLTDEVGIAMEFELLERGRILMPHFHLYSDQNVQILASIDADPAWRGRPRPAGRYVSTGWIPPHFLNDGVMIVDIGLATLNPFEPIALERSVLAFSVIDSFDGIGARGDWHGPIGGAVRPMLKWTTSVPKSCAAAAKAVAS